MWLTVIGWEPGLVFKIVDLSMRLKMSFKKNKNKKTIDIFSLNVIAKT